LTTEEIHKLRFNIRQKKGKSLEKALGFKTLPEKGALFDKAVISADADFQNFYS